MCPLHREENEFNWRTYFDDAFSIKNRIINFRRNILILESSIFNLYWNNDMKCETDNEMKHLLKIMTRQDRFTKHHYIILMKWETKYTILSGQFQNLKSGVCVAHLFFLIFFNIRCSVNIDLFLICFVAGLSLRYL